MYKSGFLGYICLLRSLTTDQEGDTQPFNDSLFHAEKVLRGGLPLGFLLAADRKFRGVGPR